MENIILECDGPFLEEGNRKSISSLIAMHSNTPEPSACLGLLIFLHFLWIYYLAKNLFIFGSNFLMYNLEILKVLFYLWGYYIFKKVIIIVISIFLMNTLRYRKIEWHAQCHMANKGWNWALTLLSVAQTV